MKFNYVSKISKVDCFDSILLQPKFFKDILLQNCELKVFFSLANSCVNSTLTLVNNHSYKLSNSDLCSLISSPLNGLLVISDNDGIAK